LGGSFCMIDRRNSVVLPGSPWKEHQSMQAVVLVCSALSIDWIGLLVAFDTRRRLRPAFS
jgi:hypothetical protein